MEVRSIKLVVETLNAAGIRYLVVGGLAVNAHGYFRATNDLDLVVALENRNIVATLSSLERIGYRPKLPVSAGEFADPGVRDSWIREKNMVVLQLWSDDHRRTPIDIFVQEPFPFGEEASRAVHREVYPGVSAPFVSLATLLAMKRAAGRTKDLLDIENLENPPPDV